MKPILVASLLLILFTGVVLADGPETGLVSGQVTDAQKTGLPGVLVTLQGERGSLTTVSDNSGTYRFALIVPGGYSVRGTLEGFQDAEGAVTVTAGGKSEVDLQMRLGTSEEITVTSEAPMVDKYNITAGTTVSAEIGTQTAGTTRSYYGLINALPGVTNDADNDDIQQTRPQVNGSHFADQAVFVDGVDTTFAKFGGSRVFLPTTALTEVTMETGGSSAEYGRSVGSWTNVIVKSGTNRFHASAMVQRQEVTWGADYKDHIELEQRQSFPFPRDYFKRNSWEKENASTGYELSGGGPIKRDKAWFFLAFSDVDDVNFEKGLVYLDPLPGQDPGGDPIDASFLMKARIYKFNFQPSTSHSLAASFMDTPGRRTYRHPPMSDYWTPTPHILSGELAAVTWNWSISQNVFLETKIAVHDSSEDKTLACGSTRVGAFNEMTNSGGAGEEDCLELKKQDRGPDGEGPLRFPADASMGQHYPGNNYRVYLDSAYNGAWHNGWILSDGFGTNEFPRDQVNVALTQFVGQNHEIKYGLDYQKTAWEGDNYRTGLYFGYNYTSYNEFGYIGAGTGDPGTCGIIRGVYCGWYDYNPDYLTSDKGTGDSVVTDTGFYIRDRFTVGSHFTFNIGVRGEDQLGENDIGREVFDAQYVSPRFAASYDINANGKMLVSLNAGRYHAQLNQAWIAGGGTSAGSMHDKWNGFEGLRSWLFCGPLDAGYFGGVLNWNCLNEAGEPEVGYTFLWQDVTVGHMWDLVDAGVFQSDIDPYYKDEIVLGFEWQFSRNWAVDAKFLQWELKDMMFSNTQLGLGGQQFYLTANTKNLPSILKAIDDARVAGGAESAISQSSLDNFQPAQKEYKAIQIQLNRRVAGGWAWYNNVSFSETDTTGSGAWWNNTNSNYAEDFHITLTQTHIDGCVGQQAGRVEPIDCQAKFAPFLGQPVSTINRLGKDINNDRPIILNSFGFKTWRVGKQDLTLGGHLTFQSGLPWLRFETVGAVAVTGGNRANSNVELRVDPASGRRRHTSEYTLNLSGAWGFPLGGKNVRGEFRVEVINATDQQRLRNLNFGRQSGLDSSSIAGRGEVWPARRVFQRPRQVRANFTVRF